MSPRIIVGFCIGFAAAGSACKSQESERKAPESTAPLPPPEPVKFTPALPGDFAPVTLRGEGSEMLKAPAGAKVAPSGSGFDVRAEPDFALHVRFQAPQLSQIEAGLVNARRVSSEGELSVFRAPSGEGFGFVMIRELVPEWDENDRRRIACTSAEIRLDGSPTPPEALRFSKAAVEKMIGACGSLALPQLE